MDGTVIDRLAQANVLVVGDLLLDRFVEGKVSRISPEAPVPVLRYGSARPVLGGAGNVAANLLSYGATVTLVGVTGEDEAAAEVEALCRGFHRLTFSPIRDATRPTSVKTRYLSGWHQLLRVDAEDARPISASVAKAVIAAARAAMAGARVVVLSDYAKGVLDATTARKLISDARAAGAAVIVDPKRADATIFAGAALLTPNVDELAQISGLRADSDAERRSRLPARARAGLDRRRAGDARRGGMTLVERNGPATHVPAETHRVFDVTGAGDTVAATLAAALAVGESLADAVRLANTAAGIAVTKPGTASVLAERAPPRASAPSMRAGVVERGEAVEHVALWKEQGLKVGFTNGCFDLLHRGHLYSLEQARRRVDRLVVGVNGDASAAAAEGSRPAGSGSCDPRRPCSRRSASSISSCLSTRIRRKR